MSNTLYDRDFYAWVNQQAALLRTGRLSEADICNIAEEIESMGRSEKRELVNHLAVLLLQLLKWRHKPGLRGSGWRLTIEAQRAALLDHLADNPSLRARLDEATRSAYRQARIEAERERSLVRATFPEVCPFAFDDAIRDDFWPD